MPLSPDFIDYACELIAGFGKVEVKRMFGGAAVSRNGVGFAILDDDTFFLKADAVLGAELEAQGCKPWVYSIKKDGTVRQIAYWSLPATAADDPEEAVELVKRAFVISVQAAKDKQKETLKKKPAHNKAPVKKAPVRKALAKKAAKSALKPRAKK